MAPRLPTRQQLRTLRNVASAAKGLDPRSDVIIEKAERAVDLATHMGVELKSGRAQKRLLGMLARSLASGGKAR